MLGTSDELDVNSRPEPRVTRFCQCGPIAIRALEAEPHRSWSRLDPELMRSIRNRGSPFAPALKEGSMILVSVMYANEPGSTFDRDYYLQTHIPLVRERWNAMGLEDLRLVRGIDTPDGSPPYQVIALPTWRSMQDFQEAARVHGQEIFADIPNFTTVRPVVQISEQLT